MKQTLKIGITLVVVAALAMSGIALAATGDDDTSVTDSPLYAKILDELTPFVDDGAISDATAAEIAEALAESFPRMGPRPRAARGLAAVADFLGLDGDEMRAALEEYDTIAEIAVANGSSADAVITHLLSLCEERLTDAVESGRITEEEKAEILADAEERITEMVNGDLPEPGEGPFAGRRGRHGGHGPGGFGPGDGSGPIHDVDA